jgi:PucR family transcriptional regulator, purine catabolism regulatory protein
VTTPQRTRAKDESDELETLRTSVRALQTQNGALRQLVLLHDRLGALVLQGADTHAITRGLAELVGRRVLVLDALLQVVAAAGAGDLTWAPDQGYVRAVLGTLGRERRPLRVPPMVDFGVAAGCVLAPVGVGDAVLGYLAILADVDEIATEDVDLQIVQHASTVYALAMLRERMATEVARQLKDELFDGLLMGRTQDEQVARERALRLGYRPERTYRVLRLVAEDADEEAPESGARLRRLLESLAEFVTRRAPETLSTIRDDELVLLVAEPESAVEWGRLAMQQANALLPTWRVTVGVGGTLGTASAIARSYEQARRALETARRFSRHGDVVCFDDLGLYRLLFHVTDPAELRGFTDQVLGPLIEYDQRHNADFVRTLAMYLSHNGNLQATARDLSLHVNSVAYRLQRIQSIASLDLENAEDRLLAQVALKILDT